MLDYGKYSTVAEYRQGNGNGYDQLDGEWALFYKVASRFNHKAQAQDREDLLQDIMITLADVASHNGH